MTVQEMPAVCGGGMASDGTLGKSMNININNGGDNDGSPISRSRRLLVRGGAAGATAADVVVTSSKRSRDENNHHHHHHQQQQQQQQQQPRLRRLRQFRLLLVRANAVVLLALLAGSRSYLGSLRQEENGVGPSSTTTTRNRVRRSAGTGSNTAADDGAQASAANAKDAPRPTAPSSTSPVHVLFGLAGNHDGFIREFEVALKSVLMNAPVDVDVDDVDELAVEPQLTIHVMADADAYEAVSRVFAASQLDGDDDDDAGGSRERSWRCRVPIEIRTYDVESRIPAWSERRRTYLERAGIHPDKLWQSDRHTIGAWFRLFAHEVLPASIHNVLYLDTDVVVYSNLQELWRNVAAAASESTSPPRPSIMSSSSSVTESKSSSTATTTTTTTTKVTKPTAKEDAEDPLFYVGETECSCFVVLNMRKTERIWESAAEVDLDRFSRDNRYYVGDQLLFRAVAAHSAREMRWLPDPWDFTIAGKMWRYKRTKKLLKKRPEVGMMHFNGGGKSKDAYFVEHNFLRKPQLDGTFGLAKYYVHLPWSWVRLALRSRCTTATSKDGTTAEEGGYPVKLFHERRRK